MPYLLTFSAYWSYLPGDICGSTDRHIGCREAEPRVEDYVRKMMLEPDFQLSRSQDRRAVRDAIVELCAQKGWWLVALHVRTTHVHMVVDADVAPELILQACKAHATRALKSIQAGFWQAPFTMCWTAKGRGWKSPRRKDPLIHRGLVAGLIGAVVEGLK